MWGIMIGTGTLILPPALTESSQSQFVPKKNFLESRGTGHLWLPLYAVIALSIFDGPGSTFESCLIMVGMSQRM